jgi:hypothetical protein
MMEIMVMVKDMTKNMDRALRMARSTAARMKRRKTKDVISERTMNLFAKLRRMRKNK